jgi:hypothetical protein
MKKDEIWVKVLCFVFERQCPTKYAGYVYLCDGLCEMIENDLQVGFLKSVYGCIAEKHKTGTRNIERCLRTLISVWWQQNKCGGLFPVKPTAGLMLSTCAQMIRMEHVEKMIQERKANKEGTAKHA